MSFCRLVQQHFTVVLPHTHRVEFSVPLNDTLLLIVFSDSSCCLYDFITNQDVAKLKLTYAPTNHCVASSE